MLGEFAFQAAQGNVVGRAFGDLPIAVDAVSAGAHPDLGERGDVQRRR
jgi:hypothetical protein